MHNKKREMLDLVQLRQAHLTAAEKALTAGDQETYNREMAEATGFNGRIQAISDLLTEQDRFEVGAVDTTADTAQIEDMVQRMRVGMPARATGSRQSGCSTCAPFWARTRIRA